MSAVESLSAVSRNIALLPAMQAVAGTTTADRLMGHGDSGERIESMLDSSLSIVAFVDSRDESRAAVTVRRVDSYGFALN